MVTVRGLLQEIKPTVILKIAKELHLKIKAIVRLPIVKGLHQVKNLIAPQDCVKLGRLRIKATVEIGIAKELQQVKNLIAHLETAKRLQVKIKALVDIKA